MAPAVLLFDIDGTLIDTGGAGRRSMERAFADHTGRGDACAALSFAGMTDRAIARAGLLAAGRQATDDEMDRVLARYVEHLAREVLASRGYRVHEGVLEALATAESRPACAVGLGTGNLERGARLKLARGGIHERFAFGGFGCDHEDRAELLRVGARRGAARLGVPLAACRVVVIGDTPKDVAAARAIGAECIAVCTGGFGPDALADATIVVGHLGEPRALEALVR